MDRCILKKKVGVLRLDLGIGKTSTDREESFTSSNGRIRVSFVAFSLRPLDTSYNVSSVCLLLRRHAFLLLIDHKVSRSNDRS